MCIALSKIKLDCQRARPGCFQSFAMEYGQAIPRTLRMHNNFGGKKRSKGMILIMVLDNMLLKDILESALIKIVCHVTDVQ